MKYTNTYNGHTYWISEGKVKVSNGEIVRTSNMDIPTFNAMIFNGDMVAIEVNKENFTRLVDVAKAESPNHNVRFLAFVEHMAKRHGKAQPPSVWRDSWHGLAIAKRITRRLTQERQIQALAAPWLSIRIISRTLL